MRIGGPGRVAGRPHPTALRVHKVVPSAETVLFNKVASVTILYMDKIQSGIPHDLSRHHSAVIVRTKYLPEHRASNFNTTACRFNIHLPDK